MAAGDLNNIYFHFVTPSGVSFGSPGTTVVTTSPQTFTLALPTSGTGAERGLWKAQTANVSDSSPRVAANFRVPRVAVVGVRRASNANIMQIKDGQGRPIFNMSFDKNVGLQPTLMGQPCYYAADVAAIATNALAMAYGDIRRAYQIVDRTGIRPGPVFEMR